jgi:hypothetical protein
MIKPPFRPRFRLWLRRFLIGAPAVFVALQLTNPARTNPPVAAGHDVLSTDPPPAGVAVLLRRACYDCHSHETQWPWYSGVAPLSWLVVDHVNEGRRHLDFSDWPHDDPQRAARKWSRIEEAVAGGDMPLPSYTWIHPPARLTAGQRSQLAAWAEQEAGRLRAAANAE